MEKYIIVLILFITYLLLSIAITKIRKRKIEIKKNIIAGLIGVAAYLLTGFLFQ